MSFVYLNVDQFINNPNQSMKSRNSKKRLKMRVQYSLNMRVQFQVCFIHFKGQKPSLRLDL